MEKGNAAFDSLKAKVEILVREHKKLHDKVLLQEKKQRELMQLIDSQKNIIKNLEGSNKITKLAQAISKENENTSDVKSKINELVREIDKCMALLNN